MARRTWEASSVMDVHADPVATAIPSMFMASWMLSPSIRGKRKLAWCGSRSLGWPVR